MATTNNSRITREITENTADNDIFETLGRNRVNDPLSINRDEPMAFNLDDFVGGTFRSKPIIGLDAVIDQIDSGRSDTVMPG